MFSLAIPHRSIRRAVSLLGPGLAAALLLAADIDAQTQRRGFNFSIGAGLASVGATCAGCAPGIVDDRFQGFSGVLRVGGAITPQLVVGAEGMGWIRNSDGFDRRIAAASVVLLGYPSATGGFFLKSGIGFMRAIVEDVSFVLQSDAIVFPIGIGVDIPVGDGVSVTPYVNYLFTFGTSTWVNGVLTPEPVAPNAVQFGLALTVH